MERGKQHSAAAPTGRVASTPAGTDWQKKARIEGASRNGRPIDGCRRQKQAYVRLRQPDQAQRLQKFKRAYHQDLRNKQKEEGGRPPLPALLAAEDTLDLEDMDIGAAALFELAHNEGQKERVAMESRVPKGRKDGQAESVIQGKHRGGAGRPGHQVAVLQSTFRRTEDLQYRRSDAVIRSDRDGAAPDSLAKDQHMNEQVKQGRAEAVNDPVAEVAGSDWTESAGRISPDVAVLASTDGCSDGVCVPLCTKGNRADLPSWTSILSSYEGIALALPAKPWKHSASAKGASKLKGNGKTDKHDSAAVGGGVSPAAAPVSGPQDSRPVLSSALVALNLADKAGASGTLPGDKGVAAFLKKLGMEAHLDTFLMHGVDEEVLPLLTWEDICAMGLPSAGARHKIYTGVLRLWSC